MARTLQITVENNPMPKKHATMQFLHSFFISPVRHANGGERPVNAGPRPAIEWEFTDESLLPSRLFPNFIP
jgi:hypothetical protein